jgi:hypothetical protein
LISNSLSGGHIFVITLVSEEGVGTVFVGLIKLVSVALFKPISIENFGLVDILVHF